MNFLDANEIEQVKKAVKYCSKTDGAVFPTIFHLNGKKFD
jgi:hypothetical protein